MSSGTNENANTTTNNSTTNAINNNHDLICSFDTDQKPQFLSDQKYFAPTPAQLNDHPQKQTNFGDFLGPDPGNALNDYAGIYSAQNGTLGNGTTSPYFGSYTPFSQQHAAAAAVLYFNIYS